MKRILGAALLAATLASPALAETIKIAIHLDENDPSRMNMVLNNANNLKKYYAEKGDDVDIKIVAYGPGLHMLRADTSPVADRIAEMALGFDQIEFAACGNTHAAMSRKAGADVELLEEADMVASGAGYLIDLQREGYAYLRP